MLTLILWFYSANTQALSATTAQVINGSQPYLTFDNGVTKITTTEGLLGITLSDGTRITPATNTSTANNPIVLPVANQSFADIAMLVPTTANYITLNNLIGAPYNYWGDDDGDGQGVNGISATGKLSVRITDKNNQAVSRSTSLDICQAPYKVELTSTSGSLTTQYGKPNSRNFRGSTVTYYISPKAAPKICYARPNLAMGTNGQEISGWNLAGPANIWSPTKGFLVQSTESSSYGRNFPTTGANNLYFDLDIVGIKGSTLTWSTITKGGITATMTQIPSEPNNIRVTITGPVATAAQQSSNSPGYVATPTLPQTFELVGYNSSRRAVLKYGFVLKQWFVNRGIRISNASKQSLWCKKLGGGYRLPQVKDITNAVGTAVGATPSSDGNYYQRNIGAGFFAEWGRMDNYTSVGFINGDYWTSNVNYYQFAINSSYGNVNTWNPDTNQYVVCVVP